MFRFVLALSLLFTFLFADNNESRRDILYTNLAGAAIITAWGLANWDYGKDSPHMNNEHWFSSQTDSGGADKLGHLYGTYIIGSGLSGLYESWGYQEHEAALYGSLSSFFVMNYMEAGDAFSRDLGFSYEDFIMNALGSVSSYVLYTHPELSKRIDLRIEYLPSFTTADVVTEYEKMKYLIALKADGFECITHPSLRYTELHIGYYTRHYNGGFSEESERILYVGIGINLSRIASHYGYQKTARFFNYYQAPYTYLPFEKNLNK